jgi:hypothetical protein
MAISEFILPPKSDPDNPKFRTRQIRVIRGQTKLKLKTKNPKLKTFLSAVPYPLFYPLPPKVCACQPQKR